LTERAKENVFLARVVRLVRSAHQGLHTAGQTLVVQSISKKRWKQFLIITKPVTRNADRVVFCRPEQYNDENNNARNEYNSAKQEFVINIYGHQHKFEHTIEKKMEYPCH
jgi:hypothetical protein